MNEFKKKTWLQQTLLRPGFWLGKTEDFGESRNYTIAVVIPAYNEETHIARTIQSIKDQSYPVTQIIVVDDCSTDKTFEIASSFPEVQVIRPEKNSGTKAQAINIAIPYVTTELFICVDGDTIVHRDAVKKTLKYFNDPDTGIVCGFVIPQKTETLWERGRLLEYLCSCSINKGAQENGRFVLIASGCFMVMRTQELKDMGGFTDRTMAEDMDLTWKYIAKGYLIRFAEDAACYVVDPSTYKIYDGQVSRWTHGFMQNLKVRKGNLFKESFKLGFVAYYYFILSLIGPLLLPGGLIIGLMTSIWGVLGWMLAINLFVLWIPGIVAGLNRGFTIGKLLSCIPCQYVTQYVNMYIFIRTIIKEFFLNHTLTVWNKGH